MIRRRCGIPCASGSIALGLYVVALIFAIVTAPLIALGPIKVAEYIPDSWANEMRFGYYPVLFVSLVLVLGVLYRVSLPRPLPTHRLLIGSVLAATVFLVATLGLRVYLTWITATGYTYGALATPIAFLLFAFFLGFAIMIGAELNAAVQEEWPAPVTHAHRLRGWIEEQAESLKDDSSGPRRARADHRGARSGRRLGLERLVDPLAVGADRRAGLRRLGHRKHLAAERDDVGTHHRALGDLVLLHVVEDLGSVVVGPVIGALICVGALDRLGLHDVHCACDVIGNKPDRLGRVICGTVEA